MKRILILTANPKDIGRLRLDEEIREIEAGLQRARSRDQFEIITKWAVRIDDLRRALLDYEPEIVHFSGHGAGNEGLALENNAGQMQLVSTDSLARLFKLFANQVECVLLDGCYSEIQATAIAQHIPYVIGTSYGIGDRAVIEFAVGFYDALAAGRSIEDAYQFGSVAIQLEGIPEYITTVLIKRGELKLQRYDQGLKQYEEELSKAVAVKQKYPLSQETRYRLERLRSVLGITKEDVEAIETRIEDIEEIRLAVSNQSIQNCQRLAQAIVRRIGATDFTPIPSPQFPNNSLWEITLPATGLQLATQNAIFYLSQEINPKLNDQLKQITQQKTGAFLIFASVTDTCPQGLAPLQVIWFSPSSLMEMIAIPENEQLVWLARFLFGQINVVTLPGMLPYKAKGIAKLFFGRENELERITCGEQKGGIIIGAHRSGKTSFLEKLTGM